MSTIDVFAWSPGVPFSETLDPNPKHTFYERSKQAADAYVSDQIANGLPADFLARFTSARNELEATQSGRATLVGTHVGARAGMQVQIRRGRGALDRLDAVVRAAFDGDEETLAKWRNAKRVHQLTTASASRGTDAPDVQQAA